MSGNGFIYFIEHDAPQVTLADVESFGLAYAFEERPIARQCLNGPAGLRGHCVARPGVEPCGYYPDRQKWQKSEAGNFWIGWNPNQLPTPNDLHREPMLVGENVKLQDGHSWHVPIARSVSDDTSLDGMLILDRLPHTMRYREGQWEEGEVVRKYRSLWDTANRTFDEYLGLVNDPTYRPNITFGDAVEALAGNYFVGFDEVSILGLFTSTGPEQMDVLRVLFDAESFIEWGKKKLASLESTGSSNSGNVD